MQKEQINNLIKDTLDSINGIKRAESNPFLYSKVKENIALIGKKKHFHNPSKGYIWKLALMFLILAVMNVFSLINYSKKESTQYTTTKQDINSFIIEYSLNNSTYNY